MTRDNIWEGFKNLFPDYAEQTESYQKIGSKTIKLKMRQPEGKPSKFLIFMYNDPWNWTFGTKVWRHKPKQYKADFSKALKEDKGNENVTVNK